MPRDQRRLAAIVCADVVGFSRLMAFDEGGTLASLKSHLKALFEPKISEYGGRIVKTTGDGLLVEFPSVVDAVRCAVDVQRGMVERNTGADPDKRIDFRIGINVGDVIIDGDDVYGDGVNVAARLQTLANPGEACVSKAVRDQVVDKLSFAFESLGPQKVKNIPRPVEAFRLAVVHDLRGANYHRRSRFATLRQPRWLGVAVVVVVLGLAVWALPRFMTPAPAVEPPAFSLVVVPFSVSSSSPADRQFADVVARGIGSALRRTTPYATVIFAPGSDIDASQHSDTRTIGRERNVRYVLEGNIEVEEHRAKVSIRLLGAQSATQLWAGDVDSPRAKWTSESAEAPLAFTRDLREAMWKAEIERVAHRSPEDPSTPMDLVVRARILASPRTIERLAQARALVDEALRRDPNLVLALRARNWINVLTWENDPNADRIRLAEEADAYARRALAIDRNDPGVWRDRAWALGTLWRWDAAADALAEAHRLDPSQAADFVDRAWLLSMTGHADEAVRIAEQALARDPTLDVDPNFRHNQCYAQILLGQFDHAVRSCEKSTAGGDDWWPYFFLTVAYAQIGDIEKAATAKAELLRRRPGFSIAQLTAMGLSNNAVYLAQADANVLPGLRKAGIPDK